MVCNYSFDGGFFSNEELRAVDDPLRYWRVENSSLESGTENPLHQNSLLNAGCIRKKVNGLHCMRRWGILNLLELTGLESAMITKTAEVQEYTLVNMLPMAYSV